MPFAPRSALKPEQEQRPGANSAGIVRSFLSDPRAVAQERTLAQCRHEYGDAIQARAHTRVQRSSCRGLRRLPTCGIRLVEYVSIGVICTSGNSTAWLHPHVDHRTCPLTRGVLTVNLLECVRLVMHGSLPALMPKVFILGQAASGQVSTTTTRSRSQDHVADCQYGYEGQSSAVAQGGLTPRSTGPATASVRKPGLRHTVHHLSPGLQRLPPRAG